MRPTLAALPLLALLLPVAAAGAPLQNHWVVGAHPIVVVRSDNARVRVRPSAPGSVSLSLKHVVWIRGDRYRPYPPQVVMKETGDTITVQALTGGGAAVIGAGSESFDMTLLVPEGCVLDLSTGHGGVDLAVVGGTFTVRTLDGGVRARNVRGALSATTRTGGRVRVRGFDGRLAAATLGGGDLAAAGRFDGLELGGSGSVEADVAAGSRVETPWAVASTPAPPGTPWWAGRGALTLRLPADLSARLEARNPDGALHCRLPFARFDTLAAHVAVAHLGEGTLPLVVTGAGGAVWIMPLDGGSAPQTVPAALSREGRR